ncbi:LLM class flavin-dependent oxidoreductase [Microbacterium lushaniae]|uniref:LLM class flavin-dependent oxidoreductase n=1 Tax=Microbacterium lushaniae TaxID=2614639 RepID=A0A5J6L5U9_9MICO|nr:LLM class flavin-dependent oxidoreductase [Microbacterium lushaniae]QEW03712.1 LLM class flavin-dependent oxidoreductase [Microbacterium lushaniae]
MTVSLGVAGSLGPDLLARLAPAVEDAGFATLWVNDTPGGDALAGLAAAARTTSQLTLATGVIPVDRRPATAIAEEVEAAGLPPERLVLGIGSGSAREGALARVSDAVDVLRARVDARIVVGALGPRMRRLGAERSDGILLNWVTADTAAAQAAAAHTVAAGASVAVYVRTAVDPAARSRLEEEAGRYAKFPNYAANFARMGVSAMATAFADSAALAEGLPAYERAADEVVLRAVTPTDDLEAYLAFVAATAPGA